MTGATSSLVRSATALNTSALDTGTFATRPSSPFIGQSYFATDITTDGTTTHGGEIVWDGVKWKPPTGFMSIVVDTAAHSAAGNASETNYASYKIPGGLVSAQGGIRITAGGIFTGTTGTKTFVVRHSITQAAVSGGTAYVNGALGGSSTTLSAIMQKEFVNAGSVSTQVSVGSNTGGGPGATSGAAVVSGTINMANDSWVNLNYVGNASDTLCYQPVNIDWFEP